jgi:spermidine synthase
VKHFKKISLPFAVFLTGACVLIIEVAATRILSPYFGNTIFTVSSVIGVVLAALSAGYYFGGTLADKYPEEKVFYSIILLSGFSVALLYLLTRFLLPLLGYSLSIVSGPVITALILFFAPSFLLGTLSPFAIKLQEQSFPGKGIGSIAGEMFFWSTLGSIFGSLSAGFVLIPRFGVSRIILAVAVILIITGFLPLVKTGIVKKKFFKAIVLSVAGILLVSVFSAFKSDGVVYSRDGIYEKITVYDGEYAGRPARFFQQDSSLSGVMFLNSDELAVDYTKYYALYKVFKPDVKDALVIGGGAYSIPKALLKDLPDAVVDVAEIEPSLYELAQKYFNVAENERLNNRAEDGRRLLHDTEKKYDLIFSDVYYSLYSIPAHFTTKEFFKIAKDKLNADGVFIANLIGDLSRQEPSFIMSEMKTFQAVFPNSYFFAVNAPDESGTQNIIFAGYNSDKKIDLNGKKIINDENPIIKSLAKKAVNPERFELSDYPILTDDFSPVEYLAAKVIQRSYGFHDSIDGNEILALVNQQLRYGPRHLSAPGHEKTRKFLIAEMNALAQETKTQVWRHAEPDGQEQELTNIIGSFYPENEKRIILAAHYDSKKFADRDINKQEPVPGANDSASGVAVLLEVARALANSGVSPDIGVDMVFFDGEEGEESQVGDYRNWEPLGSTYFAEHLSGIYGDNKPISGLVLDMVCDKDLRILKEQSSMKNAPAQTEAFWNAAKKINRNVFRDEAGSEIRDDHTPLNHAGVPSFLVIDFDYPPFHTTADTLDKCGAKSLETVAGAVLNYIYALKQ